MQQTLDNAPFTRRSKDFYAFFVLVFATLNVNGALVLLFGIQSFLSPIILAVAIALLLRYARPEYVSRTFALFVLSIGLYLIFGVVAGALHGDFNSKYFTAYSATLLLVCSLHFWLSGCSEVQVAKVLYFVKQLLFIDCIAISASPLLSNYIDYTEGGDRASGFFENPNEASVAALYCLVLVVTRPSPKSVINVIQGLMALFALAMTFSKAGMLTLTVLSIVYIITQKKVISGLVVIATLAIIGIGTVHVAHNYSSKLSRNQHQRLVDIINVFGGEITTRTTTGRSEQWEFGFQKMLEEFPLGAGLGTFHSLEGSSRIPVDPENSNRRDAGSWLGVHNTYLMFLGEAGVVPFIAIVWFMLRLLTMALTSHYRNTLVSFWLIFLIDTLATHSSLGFRLSNAILAIMIVLSDRVALKRLDIKMTVPDSGCQSLYAQT